MEAPAVEIPSVDTEKLSTAVSVVNRLALPNPAADSADKTANKENKGTHKYGYDSLNRMTSNNIAGTTTTYTYDTLGNLVLEKTKNKVVDYQYNELNQLTKKKEGNESYSYTYDKRGSRIAETGKKASRSYLYDETNRMAEGTNWRGDKSAYTYNGLGLRVGNTQTTHAGKAIRQPTMIRLGWQDSLPSADAWI